MSENYAFEVLNSDEKVILSSLDQLKTKLNFPALRNDIGMFINNHLYSKNKENLKIFEIGSGYGHSAFWYLCKGLDKKVLKIILTEKREDLETIYNDLCFSRSWKEKINYHNKMAEDLLMDSSDLYDFILIDGQIRDYTNYLKLCYEKLSQGGSCLIDNAFWKGSVVIDGLKTKTSTNAIREFHQYCKHESLSGKWSSTYLPFRDGAFLLTKI